MNSQEFDFEKFEIFEEKFNPLRYDRQARRHRRTRVNPKSKKVVTAADVAETIGLEGGFQTTYTPARHEKIWLTDSLRDFYNQELIEDVLAVVKGGKEASVYRCAAHPATGESWLAAKVYRPRMFRNLRNDKAYRRGRLTLDTNGKAVDPRDVRLQKALLKKTGLGEQVAHTSWLMHEYTALQMFYEQGAAVPKPVAVSNNAILMQYIGDQSGAAPTLHERKLNPDEVQPLFAEVMRNVRLMLSNGRVHGDLSAYNILYWAGQIILIDFPQVINSHITRDTHILGSRVNPDAFDILERDIIRVCDYFQQYGMRLKPRRIAQELWQRYARHDPELQLADASRYENEE